MSFVPGPYRLLDRSDGSALDRVVEGISALDEGDFLITRLADGGSEQVPLYRLDAIVDAGGSVYRVGGPRYKDVEPMSDEDLARRYQDHLDKFPYGPPSSIMDAADLPDQGSSAAAQALASQLNTGSKRRRRSTAAAAMESETQTDTLAAGNTALGTRGIQNAPDPKDVEQPPVRDEQGNPMLGDDRSV